MIKVSHIWSTLRENITEITSFKKFKESVNNWCGPSSKSNPCC